MSAIRKIISGGQSGVDRAALDFAIEVGIPYGGYVPLGGRAEDFQIPPGLLEFYPELREHESRDWAPRTHLNIQKTDATLVVVDLYRPMGPGTKLTINLAKRLVSRTSSWDSRTTRRISKNSSLSLTSPSH